MLNYIDFLNEDKKKEETLYTVFQPDFIDMLQEIDSVVSGKLMKIAGTDTPYTIISFGDSADTISYYDYKSIKNMSKDRLFKGVDNNLIIKHIKNDLRYYANLYKRGEMKIGKYVNKVIGDLDNKTIEDFVNKYKAANTYNESRFELVEGEDIKKWYSCNNYKNEKGTLGNSCMRYLYAIKYLDIYSENKDKIKMLILKDNTGDKIIGRAIVWYLDDPAGKIFMDRVYYNSDHIISEFKKYATIRGWMYKDVQTYGEDILIVNGKKTEKIDMSVRIKSGDYDYYPYMDTMRYYYYNNGVITNYDNGDDCYVLTDTEGGHDDEPGQEELVYDEYSGDMVTEDEVEWCEDNQIYYHRNHVIHVEGRGYYPEDDANIVYSDYDNNTYHINDLVEVLLKNGEETYVSDNNDIVKSDVYGKNLLEEEATEFIDSGGNSDYSFIDDLIYSDYYNNYIYKDDAEEIEADNGVTDWIYNDDIDIFLEKNK